MTKHTPGPWIASEVRHAGRTQLVMAAGQSRGFICEVQAPLLSGVVFDDDRRAANAKLIAASPRMYEALERIAAIASDYAAGQRMSADDTADVLATARAALAAATE